MRVPLSWLREYVALPADLPVEELAARLTMLGLKLEALESPGADVSGPLLVGRVLEVEAEQHSNGKTVRWCQVDLGAAEPRGIVCGAANFTAGDLVVVALPGAVLAGGFEIAARTTYGHVSDGMICSARELGLGDEHGGILVLGPDEAAPGDDAAGVLHLRDEVIEFEITPDRAYALSVRGVAREAATGYGLELTDPAASTAAALDPAASEPAASGRAGSGPAATPRDGYPVEVADKAGCDVFVALEVSGFDASAPSPRWLARRVQLAGMRPISLAVDVTNYVMLELGQPIHGYDRDALRGPIVVRRALPGEKLVTLDGTTRSLEPEDLLITDDRGPIGLAGVMGGVETELGEATTNLVIEAAHFDPVAIARTARRHRLPSEASKRFERGVDPTIAAATAARVADLLVRFGGGQVARAARIVGVPAAGPRITMDAALPSRVAGTAIDTEAVVAALRAVGCDVDDAAGLVAATPPPWRPDLTDPSDLVEEVIRIFGYEKVPSVLPAAPSGSGLSRRQRLRRRVGVQLAAAGYVENLSYPFVGERDWESCGLGEQDPRRHTVRISNPMSEEEPLLRTTLLPGLLRSQARNAGRSQPDVGLFEVGAVFLPAVGERPAAPRPPVDRAPTTEEMSGLEAALPDQPVHVAAVVSGTRTLAGWWGGPTDASWADAVQLCQDLGRCLGLDLVVLAAQHPPWHPGRCAQLLLGADVVGYAGELHPKVCRAYGVPPRTAAAELDLDLLISQAVTLTPAPTFSTFPVGKEDVALVVDAGVAAADVEDALRTGAGALLESARLFDVYDGAQAGVGKKSLAYALRFRAPDRTLTDAEIKQARDAAVAEAGHRLGATRRA